MCTIIKSMNKVQVNIEFRARAKEKKNIRRTYILTNCDDQQRTNWVRYHNMHKTISDREKFHTPNAHYNSD